MNTRNQEAWDELRRERDDLLLAIDRCEETKTALHMNLRAMRDERDGLAQQAEAMREALTTCSKDVTNAALVHYTAREALALPNTSADILKKRDARTLLEMAERLEDYYATGGSFTEIVWVIRKAANELENGK